MSRLSDRVNAAVEAARGEGRIIVHNIASALMGELTNDELTQAAWEGLAKRVKEAATRGKAEVIARATTAQPDLPFNLASAYALDLGEREVKLTRDLTRIELRRVIEIRRQSVEADLRSLSELERAEAVSAPIWDAHPDWLFGAVLDAAVLSAEAA